MYINVLTPLDTVCGWCGGINDTLERIRPSRGTRASPPLPGRALCPSTPFQPGDDTGRAAHEEGSSRVSKKYPSPIGRLISALPCNPGEKRVCNGPIPLLFVSWFSSLPAHWSTSSLFNLTQLPDLPNPSSFLLSHIANNQNLVTFLVLRLIHKLAQRKNPINNHCLDILVGEF